MSQLEELLALHLRTSGLTPVREYRFAPPRRWRADFAFVDARLLIEVEGGVFIQGRHSRGATMLADMQKYNAAAERGWTVLRYGKQHIQSGEAIEQIERVLKREKS